MLVQSSPIYARFTLSSLPNGGFFPVLPNGGFFSHIPDRGVPTLMKNNVA
jgi:hypothetical protein